MSGLAITREELMALLDAIVRENPKRYQLKPVHIARHDHEEFCRRVSTRLSEALAATGYCWARIPEHGDYLYRVMVEAANNVGAASRVGFASDNPQVRYDSCYRMAEIMLQYFANTKTAVVRRKAKP